MQNYSPFLLFMSPNFFEKRSRRGFSLVVSLVMMALMLMIAITLVSFVYVQARLTESKLKRSQAQINAISGMRIALGQLQLLTGDDQRVTATADLFGAAENSSLPSGSEAFNGKRFFHKRERIEKTLFGKRSPRGRRTIDATSSC